MGFPDGSVVKNLPAMQETWVQSLGWEDPLEKKMATHSSILAWEIPLKEEPGELQPLGSVVKNLPANAGDEDLIPGLGSSPGEGNGSPLLFSSYSCLVNLMDRGDWWAIVHGVTKSQP